MTFGELKKMDGLVFDPPRAGAELQAISSILLQSNNNSFE